MYFAFCKGIMPFADKCSLFFHKLYWLYIYIYLLIPAPGVLSTLLASIVLYLLTRTVLMSPGQDETRVCGYVRSEFFHWALWRSLMRTKYFFVRPHQAFWLSPAPGVLSTLATSVVLYSLTRAILMSPRQDETPVCGFLCGVLSFYF